MTKDELIVKQQLEIEGLKQIIKSNSVAKKFLRAKLYSIGAPLNDNKLKFNPDQLKWLIDLANAIDQIDC